MAKRRMKDIAEDLAAVVDFACGKIQMEHGVQIRWWL